MKSIKIVFLVVLLVLPFTIKAQTPITQGTMWFSTSAYNHAGSPQTTIGFGFSNNIYARLNNDLRSGVTEAMPFFVNRQVNGFTQNIEPTAAARGELTLNGTNCINAVLAIPDRPLSTRFQMSFADFRVPNFPKAATTQNFIDVTVPFAMIGRVSCFSTATSQQPTITSAVTGTGTARLRFYRADQNWRRVYLNEIFYTFANAAPQN